MAILWTDYLRYRARLRGFDLAEVEMVVRYSSERYLDRGTDRTVVVGKPPIAGRCTDELAGRSQYAFARRALPAAP